MVREFRSKWLHIATSYKLHKNYKCKIIDEILANIQQ